MPEDTSDDSSITDCCHTQSVTIRNKFTLHGDNRRNTPWSNRADVSQLVQKSCYIPKLHSIASVWTKMFACPFSAKETGQRDKILLFFKVFFASPLGILKKDQRNGLSGFVEPALKYSATKHFRHFDFKSDCGAGLKRFFVTASRSEPMLARLSGIELTYKRIPQQKF
ncbi:hypothetical protein [Pseudochrobactrum asaccharolyticum]|uniref:hypothetical protein n=1 Tax=Pseudochrobactrum asaccharolyticum TaxID=354351 RepID=UPI004042E397